MRLACIAALALLAAACAPTGDLKDSRGRVLKPVAEPSAVVAAEIAFNQLAQEKGQWTAFRETAAEGAEMFVPQRVQAADWLRGRADPAVSVRWSPQNVWSSCDGSHAVTKGHWTGAGSAGTYATVWQRQRNGKYKWLLDMSLTSGGETAASDMIDAKVAECSGAAPPTTSPLGPGEVFDMKSGQSADRTLQWATVVTPGGARNGDVFLWQGGRWNHVLALPVPAGVPPR